jgi:hypothetical protein
MRRMNTGFAVALFRYTLFSLFVLFSLLTQTLTQTLTQMQAQMQAQTSNAAHNAAHSATAADKPSVHGMLVFGAPDKAGTVYASHLPMFRSPHDYQIILELTLDARTALLYRKSRKNFPLQTVYTLAPEEFVLPAMIQKPRPFKMLFFRGHFERGGKPLGDSAWVTIKRVVHYAKFNPKAIRPDTAQYLVFGRELDIAGKKEAELFAAHALTAKPDFDEILELETSVKSAAQALVAAPTTLVVFPKAANKPLPTGTALEALLPDGRTSTIRLKRSLYLEYDDLR